MKYLLIHGLGASKLSWRTVATYIQDSDTSYLEYTPDEKISNVIARGVKFFEKQKATSYVIVGHSLGGVLAWHIGQRSQNVAKGISITTPWGGFTTTSLLMSTFFTTYQIPRMLRQLDRNSRTSRIPRANESVIPWLNIIGTKGMFLPEPNDGVITVASQKEIKTSPNTINVEFEYTHNEILHSDDIIHIIKKH